jgi:hypothetical protein
MTPKYYEVVPIDQEPEKRDWYYVMNPNGEMLQQLIYYSAGKWHTYSGVNISFWLKPLSSLPIDKEQAEKIAASGWDAGADSFDSCKRVFGDSEFDRNQHYRERAEYLKQFS